MAELAAWAFYGVLTIIGGLILNMLANEIYDWLDRWAAKLVVMASKRVPLKKRSRYREQWLADLNDIEGNISKFAYSLHCFRSARGVALNRFGQDRVISVNGMFYSMYVMGLLQFFMVLSQWRAGWSWNEMSNDVLMLPIIALGLWRMNEFRKRRKFIRLRGRKETDGLKRRAGQS